MRHLGLFEGGGGFSLAARWMGWETLAWCEWNEFCQKVLRHHFPEAEGFGDITKTDFKKYANRIDILTGGFPCQPYSLAGKRKGKEDERHLWPEMLRAIREVRPRWVVGENVFGLINWNGGLVFDEVQADLEAEGYEVFPYVLPACAVNAPHRRDRIWFVAYAGNNGSHGTKNRQSNFKGNDINETGKKTVKQLERCGSETNVANSESSSGNLSSESGRSEKLHIDGVGCERTITNANSKQRCKGRMRTTESEKTERYFGSLDSRNDWRAWKNFPTQSPICDGNDGFSSRLDGITFSKWRNESIKAGGNAIVPQVAFQIFKAIEQYELTLTL